MLAVVEAQGTGEGDRLIRAAAMALQAEGLRLSGAVQFNRNRDDGRRCDMDLHLLSGHETIRISQDLGINSRGCRIDADGLERMVAQVAAAIDARQVDLLIVNKFGKQEAEGRGFRPVIAQALAEGIPVLTAVKAGNSGAFEQFAEDLAEGLPSDLGAILDWARSVTGARLAG